MKGGRVEMVRSLGQGLERVEGQGRKRGAFKWVILRWGGSTWQ